MKKIIVLVLIVGVTLFLLISGSSSSKNTEANDNNHNNRDEVFKNNADSSALAKPPAFEYDDCWIHSRYIQADGSIKVYGYNSSEFKLK